MAALCVHQREESEQPFCSDAPRWLRPRGGVCAADLGHLLGWHS